MDEQQKNITPTPDDLDFNTLVQDPSEDKKWEAFTGQRLAPPNGELPTDPLRPESLPDTMDVSDEAKNYLDKKNEFDKAMGHIATQDNEDDTEK